MFSRLPWLLLAILALSLAPAPASASAEQGKHGIYWTTLENGMEVIAIRNPAQPLATIEIAVKNGAYTEGPEFTGLSHLYEHMFFKANSEIPNQERYMERLRELGASWNGSTGEERVNYYMTVHKKNLREGTAFLRDALLYPLFLEEELRREWPVVLGEFDRNEANPGFHLYREVEKRLWWKHFSRKNPIGDRDVIFNATRAQMREIQSRYYVPNNSALIVGGDVQPEEVFEMAKEMFGAWKRADDPHKKWPEPEHPAIEKTSRVAVSGPVKTVSIMVGWHGPKAKEDTGGTYAADVLSYILAQPDSAFQKALVDTGLVDSIGLSYSTLVHTGPVFLQASTSADRADKAWEAIEAELAKLDDPAYITDEQIESAKNMLEIQDIYGREQTSALVSSVSYWWCTAGLDYYLNYVEKLRGVSREDLAKFYRAYLKGKPRVEGILASEEDISKMEIAKAAEKIDPKSGSSKVAFAAASADATKKGATTEEFDVDGIKVVLRRIPGSEIVVARAALMGGLPFYGKENAGKELVLIETIEKGSKKFSKEEVSRRIASTGASMGGDSRQDYSTFGLQTLKRDIDGNFAIFADALTAPLLDEKEVALALERRRTAVKMQQESPDGFIPILANRNFYKDHPYEVPPSGTEEALASLTAEDLKKIHKDTFTRSRMKLYFVGDLDKEKVSALVKEGFADLPAGNFERKPAPHAAAGTPKLAVEKRELPTNYIMGAFDAPNMASPDFPAFQVAMSILSDRLFEEVRTKRNLTYSVAAQVSSRAANYGVLYVTAVKPNETIEVMFAEVDRIRTQAVRDKDLTDKIEEMITDDLMSNQASGSQAARLLLYDMNGGGWANEAGAVERLRQVTPDAIRAAADKYLKGIWFAALGNPEDFDEKLFTSK